MATNAIKLAAQIFTVTAAALSANAGGWQDILHPNPDKKADLQNKEFSPGNFGEKEFPQKNFSADKKLEPRDFPRTNFNAGKATVGDKDFPNHSAKKIEKDFQVGNWKGSTQFPSKDAAQAQQVSPMQGQKAPLPTLPELGRGFEKPIFMTEEQARKLIEKLYGPLGGAR